MIWIKREVGMSISASGCVTEIKPGQTYVGEQRFTYARTASADAKRMRMNALPMIRLVALVFALLGSPAFAADPACRTTWELNVGPEGDIRHVDLISLPQAKAISLVWLSVTNYIPQRVTAIYTDENNVTQTRNLVKGQAIVISLKTLQIEAQSHAGSHSFFGIGGCFSLF
jgi:hypothetical protein